MNMKELERAYQKACEQYADPKNAGRTWREVAGEVFEQVDREKYEKKMKGLRKKREQERKGAEEDRRLAETAGITLEEARDYRQFWKPDGQILERFLEVLRNTEAVFRRGEQNADPE